MQQPEQFKPIASDLGAEIAEMPSPWSFAPRSQPIRAPRTAKPFTLEQLHWFEMKRDRIAANLGIVPDGFEYSPFAQESGMGKVHQLFGAELPMVLEAMNRELAA